MAENDERGAPAPTGPPWGAGLAAILACQLAGEALARAAALPVPGPVLGMALLGAALVVRPALRAVVAPPARGLLAHLALLFVPAGVGVIGHLGRLGEAWAAVTAVLVLSTALALAAGAAAFALTARLLGR